MRMVIAAMVAGTVAVGSVAAQDREAQQPGTTVTVTGCLQRPQSAGSQGGTPTGTPASPNQSDYRANSSVPDPGYILAGAREAGARAATNPGPAANRGDGANRSAANSGETTVGTSGDRPMTYALAGEDGQFSPHVGHTVEVTGVVLPPVAAKVPNDTPDPAPSPSRDSDPIGRTFQTGVRQLRVSAVKMIAANCAQQP